MCSRLAEHEQTFLSNQYLAQLVKGKKLGRGPRAIRKFGRSTRCWKRREIRIKSTHVWGLVHRRRRWGIPCSYLLCAWWRLRLWPPAATGRAVEKRPSAAVAAEAGPGAAAGAALRLWRRSTGWPSTPHHQLRCRCEHTQERPVAAERQRAERMCAGVEHRETKWRRRRRTYLPRRCQVKTRRAPLAHSLRYNCTPSGFSLFAEIEWMSECMRASDYECLCVLARSESDSKRLYPLRRPVFRRLKWSAVWSFCCCRFSQGPHHL